MFYAIVMVCQLTLPVCTADNSILVEHSDAVFKTYDGCMVAAKEHLNTLTLEPGEYRYHIDCQKPGIDI